MRWGRRVAEADTLRAVAGGQLIGTYLGSGLVLAQGATLIRRVFLCVVIGIVVRLLWMR